MLIPSKRGFTQTYLDRFVYPSFCTESFPSSSHISRENKGSPEAITPLRGFLCASGSLGYTALYLFHILMHEFDDALVVLGVLIHQATALNDLHRFRG